MWGFMVAHFSVSVPVLSRRGLGYSYSNTEGKYQDSGSNWIEKIAKISLKNIVYLFLKIFFVFVSQALRKMFEEFAQKPTFYTGN